MHNYANRRCGAVANVSSFFLMRKCMIKEPQSKGGIQHGYSRIGGRIL